MSFETILEQIVADGPGIWAAALVADDGLVIRDGLIAAGCAPFISHHPSFDSFGSTWTAHAHQAPRH